MKICKIENCNKKTYLRHNYCGTHKYRMARYKSYDIPEKISKISKEVKKAEPYGKITKICKIHGKLSQDKIFLHKQKLKNKITYYPGCRICINERNKKYYEKNKEKCKETMKKAKLKRKDYYDNMKQKWKENHSNKVKIYQINSNSKQRFKQINSKIPLKITLNSFNELMKSQDNVCAICKNPETTKLRSTGKISTLAVDHCHKTGKIRGLLCRRCNSALGAFKDSIQTLESAINYLKASI